VQEAGPPAEFRFAAVVDGLTPAGEPIVSPERGWVTDETWRRRILRYLRSSAIVYHDDGVRGPDPFDPARGPVVPRGYRTDGTWIWPDAVEYHLVEHGVAPDPGLYAMVQQHGYSPKVTARTLGLARVAFDRWAGTEGRRTVGPLEPPATEQARFPQDVHDVLVTYGWGPGRDIIGQVDAWLDGLPGAEWTGPDRSAAVRTARQVLREFGGLKYPIYGPGRDRGVVAFWFKPRGDMPGAQQLAGVEERIGGRVFPVGTVYDWHADLVVDGHGRVFAIGDEEVHLGDDVDTALAALIQGRRPEQPLAERP
jgi:hypothetical protein